ncbi:hypothetical protein V1502_01870 [Bacillus sp. SCS-153A]|uniref:hypothetical protein n=1 Tax=Rossellomorea sedimentorum TaxID=3115294 RepID=UPI0039059772
MVRILLDWCLPGNGRSLLEIDRCLSNNDGLVPEIALQVGVVGRRQLPFREVIG